MSARGSLLSPTPSRPLGRLPATQRPREDGLAVGEAEEYKVVGLAAGGVPLLLSIRQLDFFAWSHISLSVGRGK